MVIPKVETITQFAAAFNVKAVSVFYTKGVKWEIGGDGTRLRVLLILDKPKTVKLSVYRGASEVVAKLEDLIPTVIGGRAYLNSEELMMDGEELRGTLFLMDV